jgi:hypothetical protein
MADKFHSDMPGIKEQIESIVYSPDLCDSGDLEAATRTVTVNSKQVMPDYSVSLLTAAPSDVRLVVKRVCVRMQLNIDSMTAGHLYGALNVNGIERMTFDFNSPGEKFAVIDLTEGQFNLGAANALEVFLWVDAGNAVVSVCRLWQGVGSSGYGNPVSSCLKFVHSGFMHIIYRLTRQGSGTIEACLSTPDLPYDTGIYYSVESGNSDLRNGHLALITDNARLYVGGSVTTDLHYVYAIQVILRSMV